MGRALDPKSKHWHKTRQQVIKRDGKCFICGSVNNLQAHHIKPRKDGGKTVLKNLIALCETCHNEVEFKEIPWPYTGLKLQKRFLQTAEYDPSSKKITGKDKYGLFVIVDVPEDTENAEIKQGCFPTIITH